MAETEARRTKINELIDYIDSRLTELEEEKEELKEYQEKDKDRRCLEYALYQRELEEVAEALEEIENDHRGEVHSANQKRELFTERQRDIQVFLEFTFAIVFLNALTAIGKANHQRRECPSNIEPDPQRRSIRTHGARRRLR
jgi:sugar-specific transcriptional regulator TrmB